MSKDNGTETTSTALAALNGAAAGLLALPDEDLDALMMREAQGEVGTAFDYRPPILAIIAQAGVFQNKSTNETFPALEAIVVASRKARALWTEGRNRPDCWSDDAMVGHYTGADGKPATRFCRNCPFNEWGSDPKGGQGKACKETRRLMVMPPSASLPLMLVLPPSSLVNWDTYSSGLASDRKYLSYFAVMTRVDLSIEEQRDLGRKWSVANFRVARPLSADEKRLVLAIRSKFESFLAGEPETMEDAGIASPTLSDEDEDWQPPLDEDTDPLFQ